jgi:LMBR1 domain-containing protein 1
MALLILFLFSSTISGIATVGIRFLWIRIFQIRRGRTAPQALLIATVMLTLAILAINYSITMLIAPQYSIYGTQTFCSNKPEYPGTQPSCKDQPDLIRPCSEVLDFKHAKDICTPSVMSTFLNRITITWPFFGIVDFWAQFVFLAVFLIVFVTAIIRTPRTNLAEMDEDAELDEEENLLAATGRRFNATWDDVRSSPAYGSTQNQRNGNSRA